MIPPHREPLGDYEESDARVYCEEGADFIKDRERFLKKKENKKKATYHDIKDSLSK